MYRVKITLVAFLIALAWLVFDSFGRPPRRRDRRGPR